MEPLHVGEQEGGKTLDDGRVETAVHHALTREVGASAETCLSALAGVDGEKPQDEKHDHKYDHDSRHLDIELGRRRSRGSGLGCVLGGDLVREKEEGDDHPEHPILET